jgi:DNA-binding transcriptional regulator YhcF (GntR family)
MLTIDPNSPTPPFAQLRSQIAELVRRGELPPGARLPTVRRLAADLGLAPNTVARSYRELEADGIIETRGRRGSFVTFSGDSAQRLAQAAAAAYADRIRELGIGPDEGLAYARGALLG